MANQQPAIAVICMIISSRIVPILFVSTVIEWGIIRECAPKTSDVAYVRKKATWPLIANTLGIVAPRLPGLSPDTVAGSNPGDSVPVSTPVALPTQTAETNDTCAPSQTDLADPVSQPACSDVWVLDPQGALISVDSAVAETPAASSPPGSVPHFSGDQLSPASASAVPASLLSDDTLVPSVSDSALGRMPSAPEDPVPSVTDSALAEVEMPPASVNLAPSVSDSALTQVDMPSPLMFLLWI